MRDVNISKLKEHLYQRYNVSEFPALNNQIKEWSDSRPLKNISVLDATPIFFNTGLKYLALLSAGAKLTVSAHKSLPKDDNAIAFFRECGINVIDKCNVSSSFDCICDCAGMHKSFTSNYGVVELTGSGAHAYKNWSAPVFLADGGKVKVLETGLGTGNGLLRALLKMDIGSLVDRNVLIFGGGKVGSGVAVALSGAGAHCTIVDKKESVRCRGDKVDIVDIKDFDDIAKKISEAWAIVTATGIKDAVEKWKDNFLKSNAILMNIGVEDEYGIGIPESRVLNNKKPLNFILEEPTLLRYIDPTMALSNIGVVELLTGSYGNGLNMPPEHIEEQLLQLVSFGNAAEEISKLEEFYYD